MAQKKDIRDNVLLLRASIDKNSRIDKSNAIFTKIIEMTEVQEATDIFCYMNYGAEVETSFFMEQMWSEGKNVLLPKVIGNEMQFIYINKLCQLKKGYMGILEPDLSLNLESFDLSNLQKKDLSKRIMIMPGVAFDSSRNRMGYGGGFYDRFLGNLNDQGEELFKIMVAFDIQFVDTVLPEAHDVKPDIIITESREIR